MGLATAAWCNAMIRHLDRQKALEVAGIIAKMLGRSIVVIGGMDWGASSVGGAEPGNNIEETSRGGEG